MITYECRCEYRREITVWMSRIRVAGSTLLLRGRTRICSKYHVLYHDWQTSGHTCRSVLCSCFTDTHTVFKLLLGYWHQRADERHCNPPLGKQELLVVRDKVGRPQVSLGWASPWNVIFFPSVLWHCWLGDRKGIRPVKKLDVGLLVVMIWLELCTTRLKAPVVQLSPVIPPSSFASINTD